MKKKYLEFVKLIFKKPKHAVLYLDIKKFKFNIEETDFFVVLVSGQGL